MKRFIITLLVVAVFACLAAGETPWAVYYSDRASPAEFESFSLIVLDSDHHPPLVPLLQRGKTVLGYVSAGEVENHRSYFAAVRNEGILLQENPNWKGSYFVDVRDARWQKRVLDELIPRILDRGFAGVFLDTLDNPPYLESLDGVKYRGMTSAAVEMIRAIRQRFPRIRIMMNRGYELLPKVEADIDYMLGESVFADYDFKKKTYQLVPQSLYRQQVRILKAAQNRRPQLQVFTLDYWNPSDSAGIARIYDEQRKNGFSPYVSTVELDRIVKEPLPPKAAYVPRTILALYDSAYDRETRYLPVHQIAEMPLNHLGLVLQYRDINEPLPKVEEMGDVRGILTWFRSDSMADPIGFLKWAAAAMDAGKKFVVIGDISASSDLKKNPTPIAELNRFWSRLGLRTDNQWTTITYDWQIVRKDSRMVEFEKSLTGVLPSFPAIRRIDSRVKSYLALRRAGAPETESDLVTVGPNGGYVSPGYVHFSTTEDAQRRQWYLNPFEFFREAFATDELPKLDTTTLSGRRIFYSHVDGDGWRNVTEVPEYKEQRAISARVLLEEVFRKFHDLPVTVAPIAADIDTAWNGSEESVRVAREIFGLPHVEAGTHTYSHPLDWEYFARPPGVQPAAGGLLARFWNWIRGAGYGDATSGSISAPPGTDIIGAQGRRGTGYQTPRTYNTEPFSLELEIAASIRAINALLPADKRVRIVQWSGNTMPFEAAVAATRAAGVRNLNGGDTRLDPEFHSYGWVAPLGRQVGNQRQVYASNSNENTYTELWTDRFFGFKYLANTLKNTESPIRVKPHNIYFHIYSGEKLPSLLAVQANYRVAQAQELAPVTASTYAGIVDGFYSARILSLGPNQWRIENRDGLQTVRFDHAQYMSVDFSKSSGILGQRVYQNSLYIALDAMNPAPVVALSEKPAAGIYLIHSRWQIWDFKSNVDGFSFKTQGFGLGDAVWKATAGKMYMIDSKAQDGAWWQSRRMADTDGLLRVDLGPASRDPVEVRVQAVSRP